MTCREFIDRLGDLLDGALPPRSERSARRHAATCRACAAYSGQYRSTIAAALELAEWDDVESDDALDLPQLLARAMAPPVH